MVVTLLAKGQTINTHNKKLNELLHEIRDIHSLLISFDDSYMKTLILPKDKSFKSLKKFFNYLKKNYPIDICYLDKTIILSQRHISKEKNISHTFFGKVYDSANKQGLPNAEILIDNTITYTSEDGFFSYICNSPKAISITIKHLGYNITDTLCQPDKLLKISLTKGTTRLKEITVNSNRNLTSNTHIGKRAGVIKLNPAFIKKLPGYGETSIYTFLRLMPGVLATGESSNDISVRGSSEGQNSYLFDDYKIYKPWYKLSEIGTVNPLLIEDIEVYKAGYNSSMGENVGSMVKISGKNSIADKPSLSLFVNNFITNIYSEIPLSGKSSLIFSARKNIKNTLNNNSQEGYRLKENQGDIIDHYYINTTPKYSLADINIRYLYHLNEKSGLRLGMFSSYDKIAIEDRTNSAEHKSRNNQKNKDRQYGASIKYYTNTKSGQLNISSSYSRIHTNNLNNASFIDIIEARNSYKYSSEKRNSLDQYSIKINKQRVLKKGNSIDYGIGSTISVANSFFLENDTVRSETDNKNHLFYCYTNINLSIIDKFNISLGARLNYSKEEDKLYPEPRFSIDFYINPLWKLYASTGMYNQFAYKTYKIDQVENRDFIWTTCNKDIPSIVSVNHCLGARFSDNKFTLSTELFYKNIRNVMSSIYSESQYQNSRGKNKYYGFDIFTKYQTKKFISWASYTYSQLKDKDYTKYRKSNFDNKHELKLAISYNISNNLTVSSNYIYGSGFEFMQYDYYGSLHGSYQRMDLGMCYDLRIKAVKAEIGASVLNLFDNKNSKLDEFTRFGIGDDVISYPVEGLRRTLSFYLKILI